MRGLNGGPHRRLKKTENKHKENQRDATATEEQMLENCTFIVGESSVSVWTGQAEKRETQR